MKNLYTFNEFLNEASNWRKMTLQDLIDELGSWPVAASKLRVTDIDLSKINVKDDHSFFNIAKGWSSGRYDEDLETLVQEINSIIDKIERKKAEDEEFEKSGETMSFWKMEHWIDGTSSVNLKLNKSNAKKIEKLIEDDLEAEARAKFPDAKDGKPLIDLFISTAALNYGNSRKWMDVSVYPQGWMVKKSDDLCLFVKDWFEQLAKKMKIEILPK